MKILSRISRSPKSKRSLHRSLSVNAENRDKSHGIRRVIVDLNVPGPLFPLPLLWLDTDVMHIVSGNAAAARLLGYRERELGNLSVSARFPEASSWIPELLRISRSRHKFIRQTGVRTFSVTRNRMHNHVCLYAGSQNTGNKSSHILIVIVNEGSIPRELGYYKKANSQLNLLNSLNRHDMINSLLAIRLFHHMLESDADLQDQKKKMILSHMDEALDLISQRIRFSEKYETLGIKKPVWMKVEESIHAVINRNLEFVSRLGDLEIYADPQMELVFYNLAENALRHGKAVTKLEASFSCDNEGCLLSIQDDGIGIPPENKEQIFKRGFGSNSGEGLFYVRQILDLNNMSIHETGTYGEGARFDIRIPHGAFRCTGSEK
jgi:signal transduction histidine kinase